jgi:hypothetical protein
VAQAAFGLGAVVAVLVRVQRLDLGGQRGQRLGVAVAMATEAGVHAHRIGLVGGFVALDALDLFGRVQFAQRPVGLVQRVLGLDGQGQERAHAQGHCGAEHRPQELSVFHFDPQS